ncbi:MAG TPA: acyltransferase [Pyrinomonadaceae bacterium]|nr:acyltransferase [Pyrinomonadaceae bacterium]
MTRAQTTEGRREARAGALGRVYERLSRVTSSGDFIAEVDGLRFLAIAPVVVFHVRNYLLAHPVADYSVAPPDLDWAARLAGRGHYGVELFFVISGFVLALPFARHHLEGAPRVELRRYFLRRLTRLEPPYVLVMLGCFALLVLLKGGAAELWPRLAAGLTYTHGMIYGGMNPVNLVTWSLEVEVQFYLLMPLLAAVFAVRGRLRRRALIVSAAAASVALQAWLIPEGGRLSWTLLNFLQYFFAGFLLADIYLGWPRGRVRRRVAWDFVAVAAVAAMLLVAARPGLARAAFAPLVFVLFCAAFRGPLTNRLVTRPWVTVIGGMCYTIYLIHFQLLSAFEKTLGRVSLTDLFSVNLLVHALLFAPVLLAGSAAFFLLVEKPCMRRDWPRRVRGRLAAALARRKPVPEPAYGRGLAE